MQLRGQRSSGRSIGANCRRCATSPCESYDPRPAPAYRPLRKGFPSWRGDPNWPGGRLKPTWYDLSGCVQGSHRAFLSSVRLVFFRHTPSWFCPQCLWDTDCAQPVGHKRALFERVQLPRSLLQGELLRLQVGCRGLGSVLWCAGSGGLSALARSRGQLYLGARVEPLQPHVLDPLAGSCGPLPSLISGILSLPHIPMHSGLWGAYPPHS